MCQCGYPNVTKMTNYRHYRIWLRGFLGLLLVMMTDLNAVAQSPYEGTYRGLFYATLSGTVNQPESGIGPAVINVDANGVVNQSGGGLIGQVDGTGSITWQVPNVYEFTTGTIAGGVIASTGSRKDAGLTTTFRLAADSGAGPASPANQLSRSLRLVLSTPHVNELEGAAYGNNTYVVVGRAGLILRSPNGTNWLHVPTGFGMDLLDVAFGENTFVAVGEEVDDAPLFGRVNNSTTVYYSTDNGFTWSVANTGGTLDFLSVAYGNGRFVAGGRAGVYQSDDGITWSAAPIPGSDAQEWSVVDFVNGRFVIFGARTSTGAHNAIATSVDGVTWNTAQNYNNTGAAGGQVAFGNGTYVITSSTRTFTFTSGDATGAAVNSIGLSLGGIVFDGANSRFIANVNGTIHSSTDGVSWSQLSTGAGNGGDEILFANGRFLKPGFELGSSTDGVNWTIQSRFTVDLQSPAGGSAGNATFNFSGILHGNGRFVGLNGSYTGVSIDGENWNFYTNPMGGRGVFDGGRFVRLGTAAQFSADGVHWTSETLVNPPVLVEDMAFGGGVYVTVGQSGNIYSSTDAITWTKRDAGTTATIYAVHYAKGRFVGVGDSRVVYSDDGIAWNSFSAGSNTYRDVHYANSLWVKVGAHDTSGARIQTSLNGTTWTDRLLVSTGSFQFNGVTYAGGEWVAVGSSAGNQRGSVVYTSTDGISWVEGEAAVENGLAGVMAANGALLAWGSDALLKGEYADTASPVITIQPAGATVMPGQNLTFSATATGVGTLNYQWFKNGVPLVNGANVSGANTANLTIANAQTADGGDYTVAVSNGSGSRLSVVAHATAPPVITQHPQSTVQFPTSGATFTVQATGDGPFTYVWKRNGSVVVNNAHYSGQGTATLDVSNVDSSHAGIYTVEVSNAAGTTPSSSAGLSIYSQPGFNIDDNWPAASLAAASSGSVLVRSIAPTGDGGAIIGGVFTFNKSGGGTIVNLARIKPDGTLDESFAPNPNNYVMKVIQLANGNILISGTFTTVNGNAVERFVRLTSTGATDAQWTLSATSYIYSHVRRPDGKYFVGGGFAALGTVRQRYLGLLDAEGAPDASESFITVNSQVEALGLQGNALIAAGAFTVTNPDRLVRLTASSPHNQDTTFNMSGVGPNNTVHGMLVAENVDEGIFIAGTFSTYNGVSRSYLVKVDKDGIPVTSFNAQMGFRVRDVVMLGGKLLVGGDFSTAGGGTASRIAMLDPNTGSLDTSTIDFGAGANQNIYDLGQDGQQHTFIGGDFSSFAGNTTLKGLARITGSAGNTPLSLAIVGQPVGVTASEGDAVTLSVAAIGAGQLNFQWKKGTDDVPGATASSISLTSLEAGDAGDYTVVVKDIAGGSPLTSAVATVTVILAPKTYAQYAAGIDWIGKASSPGGDADMDGLPNIGEFVFGSHPNQDGSVHKPYPFDYNDGGTLYPSVRYTRNTQATGITIIVTAATDSGFVNTVPTTTLAPEDIGGGLEQVTVRGNTPLSSTTTIFFHVQVSQP